MRLTKGKRESIAASLQQGVSHARVLTDIREDAINQLDDNFKRHHLTDKRDLLNIKASFALDNVKRHPEDQVSVQAWIDEWAGSEGNPVLFCKFQGQECSGEYNLTKDDFAIVIQNPFQKQMAQKFAHRGICVDSTHGTTGYDFLLTSIVVLDEFGQGIPVAWLLSNHEDFTHMCLFFEMVKKNCGVLSPQWVMSDMASQFYNAWVGIMGGCPRRLLCTWHVDRAWQTELRAKVKDTIVAAELYKMLRVVLQQTDINLFEKYLSELIHRLPTISIEFSHYFNQEWASKVELWAYCHRKALGINTNMAVEAFHRVFKYNYLKGKVNKRVNNCLINLLHYIRDTCFDRVIKLTKGKSTHKSKLIQDRHKSSKDLSTSNIQEEGDCRWKVASATDNGITYTVIRQANKCLESSCKMICVECNICIHQYVCNCTDSLIHNTTCKHIHMLQQYLTKADVKDHKEDGSVGNEYNNAEIKLVASQLCKEKKYSNNLISTRKALQEKLRLLAEELTACEDIDIIIQISKQVNASHHLYKSMQKQNSTMSPMKPVSNSPANKNIDPQRKFRSTKKKRKQTTKVRFAKPTHDDISALFTDPANG